MSEILLAKPKLPPDWLDVSVGEAYVVREALNSVFDLDSYRMKNIPRMEYPFPTGYQPLVDLLEDKYQAPVVITNGAKQALGASFYALHKMGKRTMLMRSPHWVLIPPLAEMHGIECVLDDTHREYSGYEYPSADSVLCLSPNNPDGWTIPTRGLEVIADAFKEEKVPFIHDAVYYSHVYLPTTTELKVVGDVQIYSASKMFGLSGLRIGWAVCPNPTMYHYIQEYMEAMTVGVSILPQIYVYDLMSHMHAHPQMTAEFEQKANASLYQSKKLMLQVDPEVLEVPPNFPNVAGMFAFCKKGPKANFEVAKINVADGKYFGATGYVRMNIAHNEKTMEEIVRRLNSAARQE